jgi:hypothetical protein
MNRWTKALLVSFIGGASTGMINAFSASAVMEQPLSIYQLDFWALFCAMTIINGVLAGAMYINKNPDFLDVGIQD